VRKRKKIDENEEEEEGEKKKTHISGKHILSQLAYYGRSRFERWISREQIPIQQIEANEEITPR
jgi:hypothetical protein